MTKIATIFRLFVKREYYYIITFGESKMLNYMRILSNLCRLVLISILILSSCKLIVSNNNDNEYNSPEVEKIQEVITNIFAAYNNYNLFSIMSYFDSQFLHNGQDYYAEQSLWQARIDIGGQAIVSNLIVYLNDYYADVTYNLSITKDGHTYYYNVPENGYDDVSKLRKVGNKWLIYGNQLPSTSNYYTISINSSPNGATIYLDDENTYNITPAELYNVYIGSHSIRLYKEGYNEYTEIIDVPYQTSVNAQLTTPQYPKPEFTIISPIDNTTYYESPVDLQGYIKLQDGMTFRGELIILTLNGNERQIFTNNDGEFDDQISLTQGENHFKLRATSEAGNTGISDDYTIYYEISQNDIIVQLTWDSDSTDLDLHIWDPEGNHCYWDDLDGIPGGSLDIDDQDGYGPETFIQEQAVDGTYIVKVHFFSGYSPDNPTSASVQIVLNGIPEDYGPYLMQASDYTGENPDSWWYVTNFTIVSGKKTGEGKDILPYIIKKVTSDMKNIGTK